MGTVTERTPAPDPVARANWQSVAEASDNVPGPRDGPLRKARNYWREGGRLRRRQYDVTLLIRGSYPFFVGAGVLGGLSELARSGTVSLRMISGGLFDPQPGHHLITLDVAPSGSRSARRVVVDVADRADYFCDGALAAADRYFKRSFDKTHVAALPDEFRARVRPYGLDLPSLGSRGKVRHLHAAVLELLRQLRAGDSARAAGTRFWANALSITALPGRKAFIASPTAGSSIILQTRIWSPDTTDDLGVNQQRIDLVGSLREAFGERFVGGIVAADEFARATCPPDLLLYESIRRSAYLARVRGAGIGVYVRGLHGSVAIKMAEYLAAGLCIVSEPLQHEFTEPLREGVNLLTFRGAAECRAQCQWLLDHPQAAARMRAANLDYFQHWVTPRALVLNLLARIFE